MRGFEGRRKQSPKPPQEDASVADFFPPPKERYDEKGEVIPLIRPLRMSLLSQEVKRQMKEGKDFRTAFDNAFNYNTFWKKDLDPESLGAYAQTIHDTYGVEYRPQDDWFHRDIVPNVAEEREAMDREHSPTKEEE